MSHFSLNNQTFLRMKDFIVPLLNKHNKSLFLKLADAEQIVLQFWYKKYICDHMNCRTRLCGDPKNKSSFIEKEQISSILFFYGKISYLRSHHLVLWSLGTLTGQQRFYGSGLVTYKGRYYHPLNVLPQAYCISLGTLTGQQRFYGSG